MIETLQKYGFSEKEAKVYLACLQLGSAPGSTIARHTGEKRVTVYSLLIELTKKWYVQAVTRNGVKYFSAISPEFLMKQLDEKHAFFQEKLPELLALSGKIGNKTKVQFFEGPGGLKALFDEFSKTTIDMKVMLTTRRTDKESKLLVTPSANYRKMRKQKWLISRRIVDSSIRTNAKKEKVDDKLYNRKTIMVKNHPLSLNADVNIFWPGYVSFLFFENEIPHALLIQSDVVFQTFNDIFEYIWSNETKRR